MNFSPLSLYKLVDSGRALVIIGQHDSLAPGQGKEVATAGRDDMAVLLHKYLGARERGLSFEQAQLAALEGATVVSEPGKSEIVRLPGRPR